MTVFRNIPFLRILVPFVAGIAFTLFWPEYGIASVFPGIVCCSLLAVVYFFTPVSQHRKYLFIPLADLFLFCTASYLCYLQNDLNNVKHYSRFLGPNNDARLLIQVMDVPIKKERFTKVEVRLLGFAQGDSLQTCCGRSIAYFRNSLAKDQLKSGDMLVVRTKLSEINSPKNPGEFNYQRHLFYRNIHHHLFIDSNAVVKMSTYPRVFSWQILGLQMKSAVLQRLRKTELEPPAFALCAALITGYDDEIDPLIIQSFAHSGTLHILSVSGLHVGLIYLLLDFLFQRVDVNRRRKLPRLLVTLSVLWTFAFLTGFSAPVLRASLMFSFLGLGRIYFRSQSHNQLNILLFSAFLLLFYNPFYVCDLGFLLSYGAMFGLLYIQPAMFGQWQPKQRLMRYVWESATASVSATITTLPLTLFVFKQFPLWFIIANLVVVPVSFLLMLLAGALLIYGGFLANVANMVVKFLVYFVSFFDGAPAAYLDGVDVNGVDACFLTVVLIVLAVSIRYRSFIALRRAMLILIAWQLYALFSSYQSKRLIQFSAYCIPKEEVYTFKCQQRVLLSPCPEPVYQYHVKPHITSFNYANVQRADFNFLKVRGKSMLILNHAISPQLLSGRTIHTLLISENYRPSERELKSFKGLKTLVAGCNNSFRTIRYAEELSRKFKLDFYNVKKSGCFQLNFD